MHMARDVKIFFRGRKGSASAQSILEEAGCGPDVATLKDPYYRPQVRLTDEQIEALTDMVTKFQSVGVEVELADDETKYPTPKVDDVTVTLDADDPRLPNLISILDRHDIPWLDEGLNENAN